MKALLAIRLDYAMTLAVIANRLRSLLETCLDYALVLAIGLGLAFALSNWY